jgi:5-methylcytosine-specific restriction endonuclease McrA
MRVRCDICRNPLTSLTRSALTRAWGFANALSGRFGKSRSGRVAPSAGLRARVLERDNFRCRRCGATADEGQLVIDHVTPVAKGGKTELDNLQSLCRLCNAGKRDRQPTARDLEVTR